MMDEQIVNEAIAESLDDFSYAQSMAESYVREQLSCPVYPEDEHRFSGLLEEE